MRDKCLPVYLSKSAYERLTAAAVAADRDPSQQARWLIRQALGLTNDHVGEGRQLVEAGAE